MGRCAECGISAALLITHHSFVISFAEAVGQSMYSSITSEEDKRKKGGEKVQAEVENKENVKENKGEDMSVRFDLIIITG